MSTSMRHFGDRSLSPSARDSMAPNKVESTLNCIESSTKYAFLVPSVKAVREACRQFQRRQVTPARASERSTLRGTERPTARIVARAISHACCRDYGGTIARKVGEDRFVDLGMLNGGRRHHRLDHHLATLSARPVAAHTNCRL